MRDDTMSPGGKHAMMMTPEVEKAELMESKSQARRRRFRFFALACGCGASRLVTEEEEEEEEEEEDRTRQRSRKDGFGSGGQVYFFVLEHGKLRFFKNEEDVSTNTEPLGYCFHHEGELVAIREQKTAGQKVMSMLLIVRQPQKKDGDGQGQDIKVLLTAPSLEKHNRWLEMLRMDFHIGRARRRTILKRKNSFHE